MLCANVIRSVDEILSNGPLVTATGSPERHILTQSADRTINTRSPLTVTIQRRLDECKQLRIIQQNVQCLRNKTYSIECLLQSDFKCDLFLMTEHWLELDEIEVLNMENYSLISHFCRQSRKDGGVCVYAHNTLTILNRDDLCKFSVEMHIEIAAVQIIQINLIVLCVYRSNTEGDFAVFIRQLELLLSITINEDSHVLVMGDVNVDLLQRSKQKRELLGLLELFNLKSFVNFPTRVQGTSRSCLDHGYTDLLIGQFKAHPMVQAISDHLAVCVDINVPAPNRDYTTRYCVKRPISQSKLTYFINYMNQIDWLTRINNNNSGFDGLLNIFINKFHTFFPLRNVPVLSKEKSWCNTKTSDSKDFLQLLAMLLNFYPENNSLRDLYLSYRCKHDGLLKRVKNAYLNQTISDGVNASQSLWRMIKTQTSKGSRGGDALAVLRHAVCGPSGSDAQLAGSLNTYYLSIVRDTPQRPNIAMAMLNLRRNVPHVAKTMFFAPFTVAELHQIVKKIKPKGTRDIYGIPTYILHLLPCDLLHALCHQFNKSACKGEYPISLKTIKVTPVYKGKGSKKELKSYRPISIVPAISKMFEMGLCDRLIKFLTANGALCKQQHAYQVGRSTTGAARLLKRTVLDQLESRKRVAAVFFDLSRAFDLVDHDLIANKLEHYGVRGIVLKLLSAFLGDRQQSTDANNSKSSLVPVGNRSVPQGSNVGNIIFLILMNDLPFDSPMVEFIMYADDICAIINADSRDQLLANVRYVIGNLSEWFSVNGMLLNLEKTNLVEFNLRQTLETAETNALIVENITIPTVDHVQFLGFNFDRGLKWQHHIDRVCTKLNSVYFIITRLMPILSKENLLIAYNAYCHSVLAYGIDLWGLAADRDRPFIIQKKIIRKIARVAPDTPAQQLFIDLKILTLPCIFILEVGKFVRQNQESFTKKEWKSGRYHDSRQHDLDVPRHRLAKAANSLHVLGPQIYNKIPPTIKSSKTRLSFILKLKSLLLQKAYYSVSDFLSERS
jgi:exonuclease III